jgi:hypothetical protein
MDAGATRHTQTDRRDARERGTSAEEKAGRSDDAARPAGVTAETRAVMTEAIVAMVGVWMLAARTPGERRALLNAVVWAMR